LGTLFRFGLALAQRMALIEQAVELNTPCLHPSRHLRLDKLLFARLPFR
jgi:hypothetical protein